MADDLKARIREAWAADKQRIEKMERACAHNRSQNHDCHSVDKLSRGVWDTAFAGASGKGVKAAH